MTQLMTLRNQPRQTAPQMAAPQMDLQRLVLLMAVVLVAGCQSAGYRAAQLPSEFRAATLRGQREIDLARVASPGISDAMLSSGDLLEVTIVTGREDEKTDPILARIADDGSVDVPTIGPVPVAGMEVFEASQNIVNLAIQRGMYVHPVITVEIKSKAINRITVLGAVNEPGVHELPRSGSDLMSALAAAGGLSEEAGTEVEIIRQPKFGVASAVADNVGGATQSNSSNVQLAAYQAFGSPNVARKPGWSPSETTRVDLKGRQSLGGADFRLGDRDVVHVLVRDEEVIYVAGLVKNPGQFDLPVEQDVRLLDAIAMAGGAGSSVADKVIVLRHFEDRTEPLVIHVSMSKAKKNGAENIRLQNGDTVSVEQTAATVVLDTITKFFRFSLGVTGRNLF